MHLSQAQSGRSQVAKTTGLDAYIRETLFVQTDGSISRTRNHATNDASSQTYNFPQKYAVINL